MIRGKVKWFDPKKGFGFIIRDDGQDEIFVHCSAILFGLSKELKAGDPVEFEVAAGTRGPKAVNVRLVGGEPPRAIN
jgi:CspA family cold shock protein